MNLLYITPTINQEGGVEKVLSLKTNYLTEKFGYKVSILTQNNGYINPFFRFNTTIQKFDSIIDGNKVSKILKYRKSVISHVKLINPDCIIICDFGLKAFLLPLIVNFKIPIVFEAHGSIYNESQYFKKTKINLFLRKIKYKFRAFSAKKFDYFIALSNNSAQEWKVKKINIIPNPIEVAVSKKSTNANKKVIIVARHSYEKGLDRALKIWKQIVENNPAWILEIYGKSDVNNFYKNLAKQLNIEKNVCFYEPITNILDKYQEASIFCMTSRSEGFPMSLLEAMSCGLPTVAFNCPIGPRSILTDEVDGFLVPDDNFIVFEEKLNLLIENENLRIEMGNNAFNNVKQFEVEIVMNKWKAFFEKLL